MNEAGAPKSVLVHLGPHKTGSTAIQQSLGDATGLLGAAGVGYLRDDTTRAAAQALAQEDFDTADVKLQEIAQAISEMPHHQIVLSHEDFSGNLMGRGRGRRVYPKLRRNLRIILRAFRPHSVRFLFFRREEQDWLRSCYHHHLRHRTQFFGFDEFAAQLEAELSWDQVLRKPKALVGDALVLADYDPQPEAGIGHLLDLLGVDAQVRRQVPVHAAANPAPTPDQIRQLERINEMSEFTATAWFAKSLVFNGVTPTAPHRAAAAPWPPPHRDLPYCALPELWVRSTTRVRQHKVADVLPRPSVDLQSYADARLPRDVALPDVPRSDMRNQTRILDYHLRGKSRLSHLNALTISYLRRNTRYTNKARRLFHRIWNEQGPILINELSTRWLISTLQTFLDHGVTEDQRMIGAAGYFYGNMIKIYEAERALDGREADAPYPHLTPETKNRFRGLDRFRVGGSDLMLNTNALAFDIAQRDPVAGLVLQELMLRVKAAETVFSRHDRTRQQNDISDPGFANTWSFYIPWTD